MANVLKENSDQDLVHDVLRTERELIDGRFRHSLNQLENTSKLGQLRKHVARLRTELRAREIVQGLGSNALMRQHRGSFIGVESDDDDTAATQKGGFLSGVVDKLSGND